MTIFLNGLLGLIVFVTLWLVVIVVTQNKASRNRRALFLVDIMVTDVLGRPYRVPQMSVLTQRQDLWELGSIAGSLTFPSLILNAAAQANMVRFFDSDAELLVALSSLAHSEAVRANAPAVVETS